MRNEKGAVLTEYALVVALLSVASILSLKVVGEETKEAQCKTAYYMANPDDVIDEQDLTTYCRRLEHDGLM